jgi:hypothetical protein
MCIGPNQLPVQLPTLFDFYFDVKMVEIVGSKGLVELNLIIIIICFPFLFIYLFCLLFKQMSEYIPPLYCLFCNILVPTTDTLRHTAPLSLLINQKVRVMLLGESDLYGSVISSRI